MAPAHAAGPKRIRTVAAPGGSCVDGRVDKIRMPKDIDPVRVLRQPQRLQMHCIEDHRSRFVGIAPDDGGGEREKRDEKQLEHVEEQQGPIDAR